MNQIVTIPNILTGYRFAVVPILMLCFQPGIDRWMALFAFVIFLSAALTDLADGYFARKHKIETVLGKLMDPLADKVLVTVALVMLIPMGKLPAWASFLIIARELVVTGLRGIAASSGIVVAASRMGKIKSILQYTALCILIFPESLLPIPILGPNLHELGLVIFYVSVVLTIWSGLEYFYKFQRLFLPKTAE